MSDNNNVVGFVTAFSIGAIIGAGVALLYAPRSGKETRELIASKASELKDKAVEAIDEAKEVIREKKSELAAAFEAGKQAMREEQAKHRS